jgi:hypothetical protein
MRQIVAAVLFLCLGWPAAAQTSAVRITCDRYLAPGFAKASPQGYAADCACVSGYLIGRYGAADAAVIVRLFAAAGGGSEQEMQAVAQEIGADRIKAVIGRVGKFQDLGREMNDACPELRKP